ncbi:MAG: GNAT family N-acetyltransferase [Solobacterium sp.]|nr:GNAT family N-acetyltransferase [Solobacterium sp.]
MITIVPVKTEEIGLLSMIASEIVKEHFDPIIGPEQNDYMIRMFQSVSSIREQFEKGYRYYFVKNGDTVVGFLAFYPKGDVLYLSKFYLYKDERGKGYAKQMLAFTVQAAKDAGLQAVELNVNRNNSAVQAYEKMGFIKVREEVNDIGCGFVMDDYVFRYTV